MQTMANPFYGPAGRPNAAQPTLSGSAARLARRVSGSGAQARDARPASLMRTSMERGTLSAEEVERVFDGPIRFLRSEGEEEAVNWLTQLRESFFAPKTR